VLYIALSIEGRAVGTLGPMAAFSLNSTKNSPAGGWRALRHGLRGALRPRGAGQVRRSRAVEIGRDHPLDDEADSHATLRGWMYLPGELTSALARSQLLRLVETTARSQRNTARPGERLARLPGVEPPRVPPDRTFSTSTGCASTPSAPGFGSGPPALRDRVLEALRADGV